jgi:nucleotide-binding universal stress UspA family protein
MPYQRILCAVDHSDGSRVAFEKAVALAEKRPVVLVHVAPAPLFGLPDPYFEPGLLVRLLEAGRQQLEPWADEMRAHGSPVETRCLAGGAWEGIVFAAKDEGCDLIVMGTHGRTGLGRVLLGSVAEQVVRHAPCAVLVVR